MSPLRILVVDDNIDAAQSLGLIFEEEGHHVRLAHDGKAALAMAAEHQPEVVFLDIGLPELDGYEVARGLRQQPAHEGATLIAMTGYGRLSDRLRVREAGFHHHLVKPAQLPDVMRILATVAGTRAPERVASAGGM